MDTCVKCPAPRVEGNKHHCAAHADEFKAKLASWRRTGVDNMFQYPYGQSEFHDTTVREEARRTVEAFTERHGYKPEPAGVRWV